MQGFNMGRYVPPELEGTVSFNQASGKGHALGSRARKANRGILTVRFEMPFPIWCTTCEASGNASQKKQSLIGQGVRFNAEKKKVGAYYSTPIFAFRMKHNVCSGWIEIRTDPQNTAYVVAEGARKRDTGEDLEGTREGEIVIGARTEEEKQRLASDPFAALEQKVTDKKQADTEKTRIEELYRASERDWEDPGEANRRLRKTFRVDRKARQKKADANASLQARLGLGTDLLDETDEDRKRASLVEFGQRSDAETLAKVHARPLLPAQPPSRSQGTRSAGQSSSRSRPSKQDQAQQKRKTLQRQLRGNTLASHDPFLQQSSAQTPPSTILAKVKRKGAQATASQIQRQSDTSASALVDYDSD